MTDLPDMIKIKVGGSTFLEIPYVKAYEDQVSVSISTTPIVTYTAENAMAFDTSATENITISFERVNPQFPKDNQETQSQWSNEKWIGALQQLINRWQVRTDGCVIEYIPNGDSTWHAHYSRNAYLKSVSVGYSNDYPEKIVGSISAAVGSMTANAKRDNIASQTQGYKKGGDVELAEMFVTITDSKKLNTYLLFDGSDQDNNVIESFTITGGRTQPFEVLQFSFAKNRLKNQASGLVDDLISGSNMITVFMASEDGEISPSRFVLTKVQISGQTYKVTAYSAYYRMTQMNYKYNLTFSDVVSAIKWGLFCAAGDTGSYGMHLDDSVVKVGGSTEGDPVSGTIVTQNNDMKVWTFVQIMQMILGADVWFADNKLYIWRNKQNSTYAMDQYTDLLYVSANEEDSLFMTDDQKMFVERIAEIAYGDEGATQIHNNCRVKYMNGNDASEVYAEDSNSMKFYGKTSEKTIDLTKVSFLNGKQNLVNAIADKYVQSHKDAEHASVTIKVNELRYVLKNIGSGEDIELPVWRREFPQIFACGMISDSKNDTIFTNRLNYEDASGNMPVMPNKLNLSGYVRKFPECQTEYTFGVIEPTDLTQNLSELASQ